MTQDSPLNIQFAFRPKRRAAGRPPQENNAAAPLCAPPPGRAPRISQVLALAIQFQEMLRQGEAQDCADLARLGGFLPGVRRISEVSVPTRRALGRGFGPGGAPLLVPPKALRARNWIIVSELLQQLSRYGVGQHSPAPNTIVSRYSARLPCGRHDSPGNLRIQGTGSVNSNGPSL
jgi:hypothetical protein